MKHFFILTALCSALTACQTSGGSTNNKDALIGKWDLKSSKCSGGKNVVGGPKGGGLDVKANQIRWTWLIGGYPSSSTTSPWTIESGVLKTNLGGDTTEIATERPDASKLILKIPLVGVPGQCPKDDVMVSMYEKAN